jgi:hypothetical protein
MERRTCIDVVIGSLLVSPRMTAAQAAERIYRVAVLRPGLPPLSPTALQAVGIPKALRELGYVEGRNLLLDQRYAGATSTGSPRWHASWFRRRWTSS